MYILTITLTLYILLLLLLMLLLTLLMLPFTAATLCCLQVGKYTSQSDSYLSVISALRHGCIATDQRLKLVMVRAYDL